MVEKKVPAEERRKRFGDALGRALAAKGRTQRDLADHLGTTQSAISSWKGGDAEPADVEDLFETERFLELPPGHLSQFLGFLPPEAAKKTPPPDLESAILADPLLDDVGRRSMIALYRSFVPPGGRKRGNRAN